MSLSQIIYIVGGILFVYFLSKKPDFIAIGLFVAIIADINFTLSGMPLNFRATMTIALLARILLGKDKKPIPSFIAHGYTKTIIFFLVYALGVSFMNGIFTFDMLKEGILCFISAYLAYYYFFKYGSNQIFKVGIILGGLICLGDLAYTYAFVGGFPVLRIYYLFVPAFGFMNHNFFGQICALAFIYVLSDYLTSNNKVKLNLYMMPPLFLGVLLSTSRSALLIVAIVSIWLIAKGLFSAHKGKKAGTLILVTIGCLFLTLFIFQIIQSVFHINSEFFETITARLIEEPMAMLNRAMGNNYNTNQLDSMDWRIEATNIASETFEKLPLEEKMFGIGIGGFGVRNYGNGYDAHNGILLMMIEFGVIGSVVYFGMIFSLLYRAFRRKISSPMATCIIFLVLYITSHNKELVSTLAYLLTGGLTAELHFAEHGNEAEEVLATDDETEIQMA